MSKLIINEHPLLVLPTLASTIGLNEAIILQQIHYWLDPRINYNYINDSYWVYNTYQQWAKQFPFWSEVTIRRTIRNLEKSGLLISKDFNKNPYLRLKWYTIDYKALEAIEKDIFLRKENEKTTLYDQIDHVDGDMSNHIDHTNRSKRSSEAINLIRSNIDTKNTTKITTKNSLSCKDSYISKEPKLHSLNSTKKYEREKEMINIWDKVIREGDKPSIQNKTRLIALRNVLKDFFDDSLENWETYCLNIKNSNFLMGGGANNWKADLSWATRQDNLIRVLEGYYHQKEEKEINNNLSEELPEEDEVASNDPIWNKVTELLKKKKGEGIYKSWFRKLSLEGYEEDKVLLIAPSKFIKDWILNHFKDDIINSFKQVNSSIQDLEIFTKNEEGVLV